MNLQNLVDFCQEFGLPDPFSGATVPAPLNLDTVKSAIMVRCGLLTPVYGEPDTFTRMTTHWFNTHQWTFEHLINIIQAEYSPIENVYENRKETTTYGSSEVHTGGFKDTDSGKDTDTHSEKDSVTRSFTNYHDTNERIYPNSDKYTETNTKTGNTVNEHEVSAFNSSGYQASSKDTETYNQVADAKVVTGSFKDDRTETGSYKDETSYGHKITTEHGKSTTRTYQNDKQDHVGVDTFEVFRHGNIGVTTNFDLISGELELLRHFDVYGFIAELFERDNMLMIY